MAAYRKDGPSALVAKPKVRRTLEVGQESLEAKIYRLEMENALLNKLQAFMTIKPSLLMPIYTLGQCFLKSLHLPPTADRSAPSLSLLDKALATLAEKTNPMFHSDQGWHYRHMSHRNTLHLRGIEQFMSRKGNCLDNAVAENFFGDFKEEFLRQTTFTNLNQFR